MKGVLLVTESKHHIKNKLLRVFYKGSSEVSLMIALRNSVSVAEVLPVLGDVQERIWRVLAVTGSVGGTRFACNNS